MAKAIDIARYLVQLASAEEEPEFLSHLRLQKLLYYVQGWSLGIHGKPLFLERIEAWAHGPVIRDVYSAFASFGNQPIPTEDTFSGASLTIAEQQFVQSVWEAYKGFTASKLREMTHGEEPWTAARQGLGPADRCENEITHESMRQFFSKKAA